MNASNHGQGLLLDRVTFDRLVDGALSAEEYGRVLGALQEQPAAWRMCAEAFLEAQAWRTELGDLRSTNTSPPVSEKTSPATQARPAFTTEWQRHCLVAAASFLLALICAQLFGDRADAPSAKNPASTIAKTLAPNQNAASQPHATTLVSNNQPVGKVQLAVNRGTGEAPTLVEVPVYEEAAADALLSTSAPALPDDLVQALEAEGHQVNRQRQLVAVPLADGRQMMLPVEGYHIVLVSRPSY
jgi:hypothetical protein